MRAPDFWTSNTVAAKALGLLLSPLGAAYGASVRFRARNARPYRSRARVLCVGNLTAGGSGKTPIAMALARMLAARGKTIMFLTRGYGGRLAGPVRVDPARHGAADVGDEALLLAAVAPTIVARDRAAGARLADEQAADIVVMDDGFQNFQIAKDVSLVVIDAETGFGNGRLIPAGPLREPTAEGLARTDGVVLMGGGVPKIPVFERPILHASLIPTAPEALLGRDVFAFAGIGRPEKFFATVKAMGANVVAAQGFPDHHLFSALELAALKTVASTAGALLVTTEKDYVRLDPAARADIVPVPVHAVFADASALQPLLDRLIEPMNVATR